MRPARCTISILTAYATLAALACAPTAFGTQKKKPSRGAKVVAAAPPAVDVPEPFRKYVTRDSQDGSKPVLARETTTDRGRYFAVVSKYADDDPDYRGSSVLRLYFIPSGSATAKTVELHEELRIGFGTFTDPSVAFGDVNRDGFTDLVVHASNGGNCWRCGRVLVYKLDGDTVHWLAAEPMSFRDVNMDGLVDLIVRETRWEAYFAHAYSPSVDLVYAWRFGGYVFAGPDFPAFYDEEIRRLEADLAHKAPDAGKDLASDQAYVGTALSIYLAYAFSGRAERGSEELRRMLSEPVASDDVRKRRQEILDDFLSGESATWIRKPERGESLPRADRSQ